MKKITIATLLALSSTFLTVGVVSATETKKVCVKQTDPKTKKEKEVCKDVKQHKKLEGTPVPKK